MDSTSPIPASRLLSLALFLALLLTSVVGLVFFIAVITSYE